jgi:aminopeptidase 2
VITELQNRFKNGNYHPNLRGITFKSVLKYSQEDSADFEAILNIYKTASTVDEKMAALGTIGATKDLEFTKKILELTLDENVVKLQDTVYPVNSVAVLSPNKVEALEILWNWLVANWSLLHERLAPSLSLLDGVLRSCTAYNLGTDFANKVEAWANGNDCSTDEEKALRVEQVKAAKRTLDQSLEMIRANTSWYERDCEQVLHWSTSKTFA